MTLKSKILNQAGNVDNDDTFLHFVYLVPTLTDFRTSCSFYDQICIGA